MSRKLIPVISRIKNSVLRNHVENYFLKSLQFFPNKYLPFILQEGDLIPDHYAYVCPLCTINFFFLLKEQTIQSSEFDIDHYPAKNSGGKNTVIVCKTCNSEAGYNYDFVLKDHVDTLSFGKRVPNSVLQSTTTIADISGYYNSFIRIDESGETEVTFKKNPDLEIPILGEALDKFQEPVNLNFKIPEDDKIQKALLHAAYLFCFENFGYEFVYSDSGQLIRNVLVGKENYPINILEINLDHEDALKILPLGLCFISKPFEMQSLVVNIKLINKTTGYACIKMILIPNPNDSGVEDLKTVASILSKYLGNLEINPLNNFLKMGIQNPYSQMWFNLQNEFGIKKPTI